MKRTGSGVLILILLLGGMQCLLGQEITFKATVDKNTVAVGETVILTLSVRGNTARIPKPKLPEIENFSVLSRGSSRNFSFVNGKIQTSVSYTYALVPKGTGTLTIGACEMTIQGKTYRTAPIDIIVGAQSEDAIKTGTVDVGGHGGEDIFVETSVDKDEVYVGEQVILTFRLYSAVRIVGNPQYFPPTTDDFWRDNLGEEKQRTVVMKGREYHVNELVYALFPLTDGEKRIGPARVNCVIEEIFADPFNFTISTGTRKQLESKPIPIRVKVLPDVPDYFSGGVGDFDIETELDNRTVKEGEPITVTTSIRGNGNIREVELPWMEIPGFRVYQSGSSVETGEVGGELVGEKIFRTILIPKKSGDFEIPVRPFIFFNPQTGKYMTEYTEAMGFTVTAGEEGEMSEKVFSPLALEKIGEDIHFIKIGSRMGNQRGLGMVKYLFVLNGLLLCAFFWITISLELRERRKANEDVIRKRNALRRALTIIRDAKGKARSGDTVDAYELLHRAIFQFFADKCDMSIWGMTEEEIREAMASCGESEKNSAEIRNILRACNRARYSTENPDPGIFKDYLERTRRLLKAIKKL
jgi:hypothetical protein